MKRNFVPPGILHRVRCSVAVLAFAALGLISRHPVGYDLAEGALDDVVTSGT
jgi:hypothetical protein